MEHDAKTKEVPADLAIALNSVPEEYFDLTIVCKDRAFKVHKIVVCTQCKPFAAMMNECWTEGTSQVIHLEDEDVEVVENAITYLYTANFNKTSAEEYSASSNSGYNSSKPTLLARLYVFGDKWQIRGLQLKSQQQMACDMERLEITLEYLLPVVPIIWSSILDDKDTFKETVLDAILITWENEDSPHCDALDTVPGFSLALIKKVASHARTEELMFKKSCRCYYNCQSEAVVQCKACRALQKNT